VDFLDISLNLVQCSVQVTYKDEHSHCSCCAANTGYYPRFGVAAVMLTYSPVFWDTIPTSRSVRINQPFEEVANFLCYISNATEQPMFLY